MRLEMAQVLMHNNKFVVYAFEIELVGGLNLVDLGSWIILQNALHPTHLAIVKIEPDMAGQLGGPILA